MVENDQKYDFENVDSLSPLSKRPSLKINTSLSDDSDLMNTLSDPRGISTHDNYYLVWSILLVIGAGVLYPYQALVTAADYFDMMFPGKKIVYKLALFLMIPALFFMIVMLKWGDKISFTIRIVISFICYTVIIAFTPSICESENGYIGIISICLAIGTLQAILQSSVFSFSSFLPAMYSSSALTGQALAGICVCVMRIITKLTFPATDQGTKDGALIFFYISSAWCGGCAILFILILRFAFTKFHLEEYSDRKRRKYLERHAAKNLNIVERALLSPSVVSFRKFMFQTGLTDEPTVTGFQQFLTSPSKREEEKVRCMEVWKKTWRCCLGCMLTMCVTFLIFPGLTASLQSSSSQYLNDEKWFPIILITIFNVGDFIGRFLPGTMSPLDLRKVDIIHGFRWLFYPLFLIFYEGYIKNDYAIYVSMFFFAFTNGFTVTLYMMHGPKDCLNHEKEFAGALLAFFMIAGIFIGCQISLLVTMIFHV